MLFIYRIIINLIVLISPIIIFIRLFKKKEDSIRFKEKFCFFSKKRVRGNLIWLHGASVGEILSVIPLIEKLEKRKDIKQILITSNTLSSSKIISKLKFKKTIHQFFPIDSNYHAQKFLNYWRPSSATFIDSEIWPNMLTNIKKKSIKLILLNGRITKKSFKRWKRFGSTAKKLFQKFDLCLASSAETVKYLKSLGAKKIKYIGNLKFSQIENETNKLNYKTKKYILSKKTWCAASTHNTEEVLCATLHKKLKIKYKKLLTIIIPRHVERTKEIISQIKKLDLKIHIHSSGKIIQNDTDIYLVDSYGKTKSFFKICKTVFLGGSYIRHGGQNPIEAARYGCTILHGKNTWNFKEVYSLLNRYNVTNKINNLNQMKNCLDNIFSKKHVSKNIKNKIDNLGDKILNTTLKEIESFII
jgi:3-deoxy-D-manno-octulosonic-acid transferase